MYIYIIYDNLNKNVTSKYERGDGEEKIYFFFVYLFILLYKAYPVFVEKH